MYWPFKQGFVSEKTKKDKIDQMQWRIKIAPLNFTCVAYNAILKGYYALCEDFRGANGAWGGYSFIGIQNPESRKNIEKWYNNDIAEASAKVAEWKNKGKDEAVENFGQLTGLENFNKWLDGTNKILNETLPNKLKKIEEEGQIRLQELEEEVEITEGPEPDYGNNMLTGQATSAAAGSAGISENSEPKAPETPETTKPVGSTTSKALEENKGSELNSSGSGGGGAGGGSLEQTLKSSLGGAVSGGVGSFISGSGLGGLVSGAREDADSIMNTVGKVQMALQNNMTNIASTAAGSAGKMAGIAMGTVSSVMGSVAQIQGQIQIAVSELTSYATKKITDKITTLITPPTDLIASYTSERLSYYLSDVSTEALESLLNSTESLQEKNILGDADAAVSGFISKVNDKVGNITEKVTYWTDGLVEDFQQLSELALMGPEWMGKKITGIKKNAKKQISYYIDKESASLIEARNKFAYKAGDKAAKVMAEKTKRMLGNKTQDALNKVEEAKTKALTKAKTAIQEAILKVLALIGA